MAQTAVARAIARAWSRQLSPRAPSARRRASTIAADGKAAEMGPLEERVDLRVGRVLRASRHEEAEKLVRRGVEITFVRSNRARSFLRGRGGDEGAGEMGGADGDGD